MKRYVIGIDIGTGSTKAVAVTGGGEIMATAQLYYPTLRREPHYSEQDPEAIWQAFIQCLEQILASAAEQPIGISLSSQMHSVLAVDSKCQCLTPLITWADTRSEKIAAAIRQSEKGERLYGCTGTPIHSMSPLCKIIWIRENKPDVFRQTAKFISIKEYIWYRLFHQFEIDYSIASATGLFDFGTCSWNQEALSLAGITAAQLSSPVPTRFIRTDLDAAIAHLLNMGTLVSFCIGASDGCLANAGTYALERGTAAVTIGTSGAVRIASPVPVVNYKAMLFNYILDSGIFICGGPVSNGGNMLQWLIRNFSEKTSSSLPDYEYVFEKIATVQPGCTGLICLPYLHGERAPVWDEKTSGAFIGIRPHHTHAFFLRAALEGLCFALNTIIETIESSGNRIEHLHVSGGFVHSKEWMQLLSDITGKKLCLIQTEDASAIGAAFLCLKAVNEIEDYTFLKGNDPTFIYPDQSHQPVYRKNYTVFKSLYETLKESMHQLHQLTH